ncbi:MAG: hypothetical protein HUU16_05735 [Candidatus Omnitrophica bacterium]|nr:hypothetical protein [Candidatus Omnitrophota bacterium]
MENGILGSAREGGRITQDGPCDLFRRVQKRDGTIVDFTPAKITEAIYKAAQSVGGKDRRRAETLTEYVILALAQRHQDSTNLLNIEQVQDAIEKVLVEKGHYRTARAFITYRNERARRRAVSGNLYFPSELEDGAGTLEAASVSTARGDSLQWDRERIVRALVRETNLPYDTARKVSHAVEMEIIHSKISHLTAPLIRELTNAKLLQMGLESERRLHARLGLPVYDVEQRLCARSAEGHPESVEAEILRQFALDRVLPLAVSEAHGLRDLHVHDLRLIHKPVEYKCDLDFSSAAPWFQPAPNQELCSWEQFLSDWEREESRLLSAVGARLVWRNVNSAIACHAHDSGIPARRAVSETVAKLWRHAGRGEESPRVVWRLTEDLDPRWRGRFLGARQMSLLPDNEIDLANRTVLLEALRRVEEHGPLWSAAGVEFEVVLTSEAGHVPDADVVTALAGSIAARAPVRVLFRRKSAVSDSVTTENAQLIQTVSLNFPRAAAACEGKGEALAEWLEDRLHLAAQAHLAKKNLLEERFKNGALKPLRRGDRAADGGHPLRAEESIHGIGAWGLLEMALSQYGACPGEDDLALKTALKLLARLKVRMVEIGKRFGINLEFVATPDTEVSARFGQSLVAAGLEPLRLTAESLFCRSKPGDDALIREGKAHSFFASGQVFFSEELEGNVDPAWIAERIRFLAASTHIGGYTWSGKSVHCRSCGAVFGETRPVCPACGGESLYEMNRRGQGSFNEIVRL